MNYEKNFLLVVLLTYLSMACSHNEVDCSKLQNDENLKKEFILGFAEAPTTFTAERNAEKEITGFFSNYVRYSSSYSSYDSEKSSGIEIEEDIKSSGAFDISGAQTLCALKKEKTAQVLKGLSKSLVKRRIKSRMKKIDRWLTNTIIKNQKINTLSDIDLLQYNKYLEEQIDDESIWLSLTTTKGKFPNIDKWKIKKFEKQFSTKKSRPIFIFTSDKYSLASVDLVLEKFKPFGVKPKITQSLSKADFVWSCSIKTGMASPNFTSYSGRCEFKGQIPLFHGFDLSGLSANDQITQNVIFRINENLRSVDAH